ncbi:MAG: methyltransferase domain-containing protein, partial [Rubrobacteraceae bacterium]
MPLDELKSRLGGRTGLDESEVEVAGKSYRILHPSAADALIDETEFEIDERLPYWAVIWPSAIALARQISTLDLSGKRVLELGCGVGLPSAVALDLGAKVTATDHYTIALDFARQNARVNTDEELATAHLDWHSPDDVSLGRFDLILAADVLYEQRNIPALAALVPDLLAPEGGILVSNPRRRDAPRFQEILESRGFAAST